MGPIPIENAHPNNETNVIDNAAAAGEALPPVGEKTEEYYTHQALETAGLSSSSSSPLLSHQHTSPSPLSSSSSLSPSQSHSQSINSLDSEELEERERETLLPRESEEMGWNSGPVKKVRKLCAWERGCVLCVLDVLYVFIF